MTQELSVEISPEIINSLILTGDMSKLTPAQQTQYYGAVCKSLGLNPITQPFAIITLQGKKILYATKGCTQQLSGINKISTEILKRETLDSVYCVSVRAKMQDGRFTDEDGIVNVSGLKGVELANAMLKAITKAKRRAVLALCGLGMSDESEVEDIQPSNMAGTPESGKSRVEQIIEAQTEPQDLNVNYQGAKVEEVKPKAEEKQSKKSKETAKKEDIKSDPKPTNGEFNAPKQKIIIGLIDNSVQDADGKILAVKTAIVDKNGTPTKKWSFLIEDKRYGTFDESLANKIMESVDNRRMVNIEYTERPGAKPGVVLNDIVNFSEATFDEVKP